MIRSNASRGSEWGLTAVLRILHLLGWALGCLMSVFRSNRYCNSRTNIKLCFPELNDKEVDRLARTALAELGKLLFETLLFWLIPVSGCRAIRNVLGEEYLRQALEEGSGVILVCPHLGNWEVFNAYAGRFGATVTYKPLKSHWLNTRVRCSRERGGSMLVPINAQGIKALCCQLGRGVVTLFPDQVPDCSAGRVLAPFFGVPAWTGTLVSRLAQRPNVKVICGYARRLAGGRGFEIYLTPAPADIYSAEIERSAQALNRGIESCVRRSPDQYLWQYKRFKGVASHPIYSKSKSAPA